MSWAGRFVQERVSLLTMEGRLSREDLNELATHLRELAAQGVLHVLVDVRSVDHWDYRGLKPLADAAAFRKRFGGRTTVVANRYLRDIARTVGELSPLEFRDRLPMVEPSPSAVSFETTDVLSLVPGA